jgi:lycopene cyclase domain-containing protein
MSNYAYLLFVAVASLSLLAPSIFKLRFWGRWLGILFGLGTVSVPFIIWDISAVHLNHWEFNPDFTLDIHFIGLPVSELLFFVVVPLACMVVWAGLERLPNSRAIGEQPIRNVLINVALGAVALGIFVPGIYTSAVLLATAIACAMLTRRPDIVTTRRFWLFQLILVGLFMASNTYLTSLPVVTYNDKAIIGWFVGSIPAEDFLYNFALVNLFLLCFLRFDKRTGQNVNS